MTLFFASSSANKKPFMVTFVTNAGELATIDGPAGNTDVDNGFELLYTQTSANCVNV